MRDKIAMWIAWGLPRRVVAWAYIRVMAHASSGPYGYEHVDDITYSQALKRWEEGPHPVPDDPLERGYWDGSVVEPIRAPETHETDQ